MMKVPAQEIVIANEDRDSILADVAALLAAGQLSAGENVERFEADFVRYVGARHAIAVSSGTTALELTLQALGVRGRSVIVPANTNFATFVAGGAGGTRRRRPVHSPTAPVRPGCCRDGRHPRRRTPGMSTRGYPM